MDISVHRSTISRFLKRESWSKKFPIRANLRRHEEAAEQWLREFKTSPRTGKLMALDETAFVVGRIGRTKGYAPKGETLIQRHDPRQRKMFSLLVCIEEGASKPVHSICVEGAITGKRFRAFLDTMPDSLKGNTLLLDNAAIHRATHSLRVEGLPTVSETARKKNVNLVYIPPYSPQCNPTELFFASLKKRAQKALVDGNETIPNAVTRIVHSGSWDVRGMFKHCFDWMV